MIKQINATFGTRAILLQIQNKYPDHQLLLMQASAADDQYMLLDVSGKPSVFQSPVSYEVLVQKGAGDWKGMTSLIFVTLPLEEQKVFESKISSFAAEPEMKNGLQHFFALRDAKDNSSFVILTSWHQDSEYSVWRRSASFKPFDKYLTSAYSFHESRYEFVRALKQHH